jgi:hypothetical protein
MSSKGAPPFRVLLHRIQRGNFVDVVQVSCTMRAQVKKYSRVEREKLHCSSLFSELQFYFEGYSGHDAVAVIDGASRSKELIPQFHSLLGTKGVASCVLGKCALHCTYHANNKENLFFRINIVASFEPSFHPVQSDRPPPPRTSTFLPRRA